VAIILTPDIISRASHKFTAKKMISEQATLDLSPHIWHFYEDFEMPLSELFELIDAAKAGKLQDVEEKLDGQNITFTVRDGVLLFFNKGGRGQGKDRSGIASHPVESVRNAFIKAYDAIEEVAIPRGDAGRWSALFQNGAVMIESAILTPENPNTIIYDSPTIRFIKTSRTSPDINSTFEDFKAAADSTVNEEFYMGPVPYLKLKASLEATDKEADDIKRRLSQLISTYGVSTQGTVGNLIHTMVRRRLAQGGLVPDSLLDLATTRVATGKGPIGRMFPKVAGKEAWKIFQTEILNNRESYLAESIIPLERIIQRVGSLAFRNLEFTLAAGNRNDLVQQVATYKRAFEGGHILASPKQLEGIRVALDRIGMTGESDMDNRFSRATEGIVFQWKGMTRKLTGLFTPINKLRGFFEYGENKATIQEPITSNAFQEAIRKNLNKLLFEGGNAFKDAEGNIVTRQDRIPRSDVEPIVANFVKDILTPLRMDYIGVGTTVTNTPDVGDVDVVVSADSARDLYSQLSTHPELQRELIEAPGVNRLYNLPGGAGVAVLYKVPVTGDLVQVDVMPSKGVDLDHVSWMLAGAGAGGVKSRYRNLMLSWIAKNQSARESAETNEDIKYTYARGLLKRVNGMPEGPRETNPDIFLPMMGINVSKDEVRSFEGLVSEMRKDEFLSSILMRYREYLDNKTHLMSANPKRRAEAEAAVRHIEGSHMEESFRELIKNLLTESEALNLIIDTGSLGEKGNPKIDYRWLNDNSVEDPLYDHASKKLYPAGYAALLKGMTSEAAEKERVEGEKFEHGIIAYAKEIGAGDMKRVGGEGEDLQGVSGAVQGRSYELKKTKQSTPNLKLNSSFPKGKEKHYYMFITNLPMIAEMKAGMAKLSQTGKDFETFEGELDELNNFMQEIKYFSKTLGATERDSIARRAKERLKMSSRQQALPLPDRETSVVTEAETEQNVDTVDRFISVIDAIGKKNYDNYGKSDVERLKVIETLEYRGKVSKAALEKQITQKLDGSPSTTQLQKELTKVFRNILGDMRCWIVPSTALRVSILASAFKNGEGKIFDKTTGHLLPGGKKHIEEELRKKFGELDLAGKLAEKISPTIIDQAEGEKIDKKESEWDIRLGLLKVRVSLKIEPPTVKGDT